MVWRITAYSWKYYIGTPQTTVSFKLRSDVDVEFVFDEEYSNAVDRAEELLTEFKKPRNNSYTFFTTDIEWVPVEEIATDAPDDYTETERNVGNRKIRRNPLAR